MPSLLLALLALLLATQPGVEGQEVCRVADPEKSSSVYDLSPLTKVPPEPDWKINSQFGGTYVIMNICAKLNTQNSFCDPSAGMCEIAEGGIALGTIGLTTTTFTVTSPGELRMEFPGSGCKGVILFSCDKAAGDGTPTLTSVTGSCDYNLSWKTAHACSKGPGGLSGGSVFLILFFVGGFVYVVAGMLIKRKRYEATGVDMVPNIDFWREVPGLVKDGCRYTASKLCNRS